MFDRVNFLHVDGRTDGRTDICKSLIRRPELLIQSDQTQFKFTPQFAGWIMFV